MRTPEEIAALRTTMDPAKWESLARFGLEPGGANEESQTAKWVAIARQEAIANDDLTYLRTVFGKNSDSRAAQILWKESRSEYARLRALAVEKGLLA